MKHLSMYFPKVISSKVGPKVLLSRKNSPTVLFAAGVAGVVATTVMASRATLKLEDVLADTQENLNTAQTLFESGHKDYSEEDFKKDTIYIYTRATVEVVKLYSPVLLVGAVSIACLTGSHNILMKRNTALMAAYAALDQTFSRYRERVIETYSAEHGAEQAKAADDHFMYGSEERVIGVNPDTGKEIKSFRVGDVDYSMYARFFDEGNRNWVRNPEYNRIFLQAQQNYANDLLKVRGHVLLNDIYDMLGIPRSKEGSVVGWVISKNDGDNYIDFGIFHGNSQKARDFVNGQEGSILLDFNVDGIVYDKI